MYCTVPLNHKDSNIHQYKGTAYPDVSLGNAICPDTEDCVSHHGLDDFEYGTNTEVVVTGLWRKAVVEEPHISDYD